MKLCGKQMAASRAGVLHEHDSAESAQREIEPAAGTQRKGPQLRRLRSGSSDEDGHGKTSSDEEVQRMNFRLLTMSVRGGDSESPLQTTNLSSSMSRLSMEDGRYVNGLQQGLVPPTPNQLLAMGDLSQEDAFIEETLGGDTLEAQMQSILLQDQSVPTRGLTMEERAEIEEKQMLLVFQCDEQYAEHQCQICLTAFSAPRSSLADAADNGLMCESVIAATQGELVRCESIREAEGEEVEVDADGEGDDGGDDGFEGDACVDTETTDLETEYTYTDGADTQRTDGDGLTDGADTQRTGASITDGATERTDGGECYEERDGEQQDSEVSILMKLPCGHVFHAGCVDRWFSVGRNCPICRHEIYETGDLAMSQPSTQRSFESGGTASIDEDAITPRQMINHRRPEVYRNSTDARLPRARRPAVVPQLALHQLRCASDTSSPMGSAHTHSARSGGAHSAHSSAHNSARAAVTMSPRSAFTDAPPRSYRSQDSD